MFAGDRGTGKEANAGRMGEYSISRLDLVLEVIIRDLGCR